MAETTYTKVVPRLLAHILSTACVAQRHADDQGIQAERNTTIANMRDKLYKTGHENTSPTQEKQSADRVDTGSHGSRTGAHCRTKGLAIIAIAAVIAIIAMSEITAMTAILAIIAIFVVLLFPW